MAVRHHEHERLARQGLDLGLGLVDAQELPGAFARQRGQDFALLARVDQLQVGVQVGVQSGQRLRHVSRAEDHDAPARPGEGLEEERHLAAATLAGLLGQRVFDRLGERLARAQELARVRQRLQLEIPAADRPVRELRRAARAERDEHARSGLARAASGEIGDDDHRAGAPRRAQVGEPLDPVLCVNHRGAPG